MSSQLKERRLAVSLILAFLAFEFIKLTNIVLLSQLAAKNQVTYEEIAKNQVQIDRSEQQMKQMLDEFKEVSLCYLSSTYT